MISPFQILSKDTRSKARTGILYTKHGAVHTPVFMPVATQACVKALTDEDIACGALYPPFERVREVCRNIAANIIINAKAKGRCTIDLPQDVKAWVEVQMYRPIYE